jgi:hypothetical protein
MSNLQDVAGQPIRRSKYATVKDRGCKRGSLPKRARGEVNWLHSVNECRDINLV